MTRVSRFTTLTLAFALVAAAPAPALAAGDRIGLELTPWMQSLTGEVAIGTQSDKGTLVDVEDDLGVDSGEISGMARFWVRWGRIYFVFDYAESTMSGSETLDQDLDFRGLTFTATEDVETDLELKLYRADMDIALMNRERLKIGLSTAINLGQVNIAMRGSATGSEALDEDYFFPTLGAYISANPTAKFGIRGEANGVVLNPKDDEVTLIDARIQFQYDFVRWFGILAGYRHYRFDVQAKSFGTIENTYSGPYLGVSLKH